MPQDRKSRGLRVLVVGTGYVGSVTAACLAELCSTYGTSVHAVDTDERKIAALRSGHSVIHEPGLDAVLRSALASGALTFGSDLGEAVSRSDVVFIAVPTPAQPDGGADLTAVMRVASEVGRNCMGDLVVVTKSTVPVGTGARVLEAIETELVRRGLINNTDVCVDVASNPEFLREGSAVQDFFEPDRVIIGAETARAREVLDRLYSPLSESGHQIIHTDVASAELTKYAANAMLATRISFMNQIAALCSVTGADIEQVRLGIGADDRIGPKFLKAGVGYGGSCFPKDVQALAATARQHGLQLPLIEAVHQVNERQKHIVRDQLQVDLTLRGAVVAIWGVSFKPDTDDVREAPAVAIIDDLLAAGATVAAFDPVADVAQLALSRPGLRVATGPLDAIVGADAVVLVTEWKEFLGIDADRVGGLMRGRLLFDGRNVLDLGHWTDQGFRVRSVGGQAQQVAERVLVA